MTDLPPREKLEQLVAKWRDKAGFLREYADFADANVAATHGDVADAHAECADELSALLSEDRP